MEELEPKRQWKALWEKYRYVLLVVGLGLVLMMIPVRSGAGSRQAPQPTQPPAEESLEQKLEQVLATIQGVGQVSVLLTESTGSETSFQTDVSSDQQSESLRQSADTVIVEDPSRQERGLVRRVDPPVYRGAVVCCQGADSAQVRLRVVEAVGCVTGLRSDQISVVKMK